MIELALGMNRPCSGRSNGSIYVFGAVVYLERRTMGKERESRSLYDRTAALRAQMVGDLSADLTENPQLADEIAKRIDELLVSVVKADTEAKPPPDLGLAELAGIGDEAAHDLGDTRLPPGVLPYDETVTSERMLAV